MRISDWSSYVCSSDLVLFVPGERYDIVIRCDNPGRWMVHDHIDHHTMNGHTPHGGVMTVIEYEGIPRDRHAMRSEEHTSELQSLMRISYAVFCLKKKKNSNQTQEIKQHVI